MIDAHVHTDFTGEPEPASGIPKTREQFLQNMERARVVGAVAHLGIDGEGDVDLQDHGVIHCVAAKAQIDVRAMEAGLRARRYGCIKIYLGYVFQFAGDSNYEPAYHLAETYDVPVVFHTGDTYSPRAKLKYADPLTIDEVAVDHPDVTFVIAHAGYPWVQSAAEVAYKNPNVFLDGSAFMIGRADDYTREWIDQFVVQPLAWIFGYVEDPSKLMFGSDWPLTDTEDYIEAYKRAIPREHWQAVFHDNATRVFRMEGKW